MLTELQQRMRAGRMTASRIGCLMAGDVVKIDRLWREMIGEIAEDTMRDNWPVRLGEVTEDLNLEWAERKGYGLITRRGDVVVHPKHDWACATLDGWCEQFACPIECKHVGGREPIEVIAERYTWQCQWQMECTGATQCLLSVIMGSHEPIIETIEKAPTEFIAEMLNRGAQFLQHVVERRPPVILPAVPAPIEATRLVDMSGNNMWATYAGVWLDTWQAAKQNEDAKAVLKSMVPANAKKVFGHGVRITRARPPSPDRAGALTLREDA